MDKEYVSQVSLGVRYKLSDVIKFNLLNIIDLKKYNIFSQIESVYNYSDNIRLNLGYNFFEGDKDTLFGMFDNNDFTYVKLRFYF